MIETQPHKKASADRRADRNDPKRQTSVPSQTGPCVMIWQTVG